MFCMVAGSTTAAYSEFVFHLAMTSIILDPQAHIADRTRSNAECVLGDWVADGAE